MQYLRQRVRLHMGVGNGFGYEVGYLGNRICEKDELKIMLQNGWNRKNLFKTMG